MDLLATQVKSANGFVLLFDESLNHQMQQKQLDVLVRYWSEDTVSTRYLESRFMGHATAEHLYTELEDCCSKLGKRGILQVSMDGPNVNWAMYDKLATNIEVETGRHLYNV